MNFVIYDTIDNLPRYLGLLPRLEPVIKLLAQTDDWKTGRGEGADGLYWMVQELPLCDLSQTKWERHECYLDLQYALEDGEMIGYLPQSQLDWEDFQPDKDVAFSKCDDCGISLPMKAGRFAIFFPQDAHRPCQFENASRSATRKIVFKIPCESIS